MTYLCCTHSADAAPNQRQITKDKIQDFGDDELIVSNMSNMSPLVSRVGLDMAKHP